MKAISAIKINGLYLHESWRIKAWLTVFRRSVVPGPVHDGFGVGFYQHELIKADWRISVKGYRWSATMLIGELEVIIFWRRFKRANSAFTGGFTTPSPGIRSRR
jgi:hypothetical protein